MEVSSNFTRGVILFALVVGLPMCNDENEGSPGVVLTTGGTPGAGGASATGGVSAGGVAAGGAETGTGGIGTTATFTITISNFNYTPLNQTVPPGAMVTVVNQDSVDHSVTSESTVGAFTPGGVSGVSFDTGVLSPGASHSLMIPASAPAGTTIPYYCRVHTSGMPQGTLKIQ